MGNIANFAGEMEPDGLAAAGAKMLSATAKLTTGVGAEKVINITNTLF